MTTPLAPVKIARGHSAEKTVRIPIWEQGGLAITRGVGTDKGWTITHVASGWALIRNIEHRGNARKAALRFLPLTDWTVSRTALVTPSLKVAARAVKEELKAEGILPS